MRGIRSTAGCDEVTGECTCKANVIGRDCNQCKPDHYGLLKDDLLGCQPCDCDIGGAYNNSCDVITGQCKCRPHVEGRQCNVVPDGYYVGGLDYLVFEAELATGSNAPVCSYTNKHFTLHYTVFLGGIINLLPNY